MFKTLRISFALKNAYRVNAILFALKQIPLLKKALPQSLYQAKGLKIFANILATLWELITIFLWKALYFITMVCGIGLLYQKLPTDQSFLHILFWLTITGAFLNTYIFNPSRDKYYAMILLRMNARSYTLSNYVYTLLKLIIGFLPFTILFGRLQNVSLWLLLLMPFSIAGAKLIVTAIVLTDYNRSGNIYNENKLQKYIWFAAALLLLIAYGLPAMGIALPLAVSIPLWIALIPAGLFALRYIYTFDAYRQLQQELLSQMAQQMDGVKHAAKKNSEKAISTNRAFVSKRKGFDYLNELFIKRHQKILWQASLKITLVCCCLLCGALLAMSFSAEIKESINLLILNWLPYFVFIMYAINRGTGFTQALFMNCDHSLLTYSFYKQPSNILKLFRIRLGEIMKINMAPAIVIGAGLSLLLFVSGGTTNPLNYVVLFVSILCMSLFFSVHYLTIYYLLQPYNAGTEIKSGTYRLVLSITYLLCFFMMQVKMPLLLFGCVCIVFCILYSITACILVYHFAPKTFRLRT